MITLAVPVYKRYDLLPKMLQSAAESRTQPARYLIIDNGGKLDQTATAQLLLDSHGFGLSVAFIVPGRNLGCAAAWNLALDRMHPTDVLFIANDDIELAPDALEKMMDRLREQPLAAVCTAEGGFALFGCRPALLQLAGGFDENFHPAYFEDDDLRVRLGRGAYQIANVDGVLRSHVVSGTLKAFDPTETRKHHARFEELRWYYKQKWGGEPKHEVYDQPFNGTAPQGWRMRPVTEEVPKYRYDVINQALRHIGGRNYLEIGVCDGQTLRKVQALLKIGVDPDPQAARFADVFFKMTSDEAFEPIVRAWAADISVVFIDGLHTADQVLRDIDLGLHVAHGRTLIVLHDCNPTSEAMQAVPATQSEWTGDVWKAIAAVRANRTDLKLITLDIDYGCCVIASRSGSAFSLENTDHFTVLGKPWKDLTYADLEAHRAELLNLQPAEAFAGWLRHVRPIR